MDVSFGVQSFIEKPAFSWLELHSDVPEKKKAGIFFYLGDKEWWFYVMNQFQRRRYEVWVYF